MSAQPAFPQHDAMRRFDEILEQFDHLESEFDHVRDGLTRSHRLATLGTISSVIAHEYNNILTPIISYAQLALSKPDDSAAMRKAVEKALAGAERAARISSSLLGFARETDDEHVASLEAVVQDAIACLARDPARDGVTLELDLPSIRLDISPLNLQQVLLNLLLNAMRAMKGRGGSLRISARTVGSLAHVVVTDTGPGIPAEVRDSLFEPFVTCRIRQDGAEGKGAGLGLAICRDLIQQAGGTIDVRSEPGRGATFHMVLPIADELFETT